MFANRLTTIMRQNKVSTRELSERVGWKYHTLYKKIKSDTFTEQEMRTLATALGYRVSLSVVGKKVK